MPIDEAEAIACLHVLVAVAKADGKLTVDERKSLAAALVGLELPLSVTVEELLAADVDVDAELAKVRSAEAKEQLFRSVHFMANADAVRAPEEDVLLARIEAAVEPSPALRTQLAALAPAPASSRLASWASSFRAFFGR